MKLFPDEYNIGQNLYWLQMLETLMTDNINLIIFPGTLGGDLLDKGGTTEVLSGHWTEEELKDLDSEGRAVITQHTIKVKYF